MIILVCGGRDYGKTLLEQDDFFTVLHRIDMERGPIVRVVTGGARGADSLAEYWAKGKNIDTATYPAEWGKYGKKAGPIRNRDMLKNEDIQLVVAFPGGDGTADMVHAALTKGIEVMRINEKKY